MVGGKGCAGIKPARFGQRISSKHSADLLSARLCHHCGEPADRHYAGQLLGCRQGRTFFKPALELAA